MAMSAQRDLVWLGAELKPTIRYDATAGAGIANRRRVGRVRHMHAFALRIRRHVQEGRVTLYTVDRAGKVADLETKHVDGKRKLRLRGDMGIVKMTGRSELSLRVSGERRWLELLRGLPTRFRTC